MTIKVTIRNDDPEDLYNRAVSVTGINFGNPELMGTVIGPGEEKSFYVWNSHSLNISEITTEEEQNG